MRTRAGASPEWLYIYRVRSTSSILRPLGFTISVAAVPLIQVDLSV